MIYLYYNLDNIGLDRFELWIQKSKEKYYNTATSVLTEYNPAKTLVAGKIHRISLSGL